VTRLHRLARAVLILVFDELADADMSHSNDYQAPEPLLVQEGHDELNARVRHQERNLDIFDVFNRITERTCL
jgi:hypothetical protein